MRKYIDVMRLLLNVGGKCRQWVNGRVTALSAFFVQRSKQWCRRRSPSSILQSEKGHQLMHLFTTRQVLGEEVRWVDLPTDLLHGDRADPNFLLDPQSMGLQMPQFSQSGSQARTGSFTARSSISDWWPKPAPAALTKP